MAKSLSKYLGKFLFSNSSDNSLILSQLLSMLSKNFFFFFQNQNILLATINKIDASTIHELLK